MLRHLRILLLGALLLTALAACGPANNTNGNVTLRFAMKVGDQDAVCGKSYPGLGKSGTKISFTDLRFYVSNIRLINATPRARRSRSNSPRMASGSTRMSPSSTLRTAAPVAARAAIRL